METRPVIIGTHAFFCPESAGTSDRTTKPASGATGWVDFGTIEESGTEPQSEEKEIWRPSPGQLVLHDIIETKRGLAYKFKVKELSLLMWELLTGSAALSGTANIQYNPLEGTTRKGWLKVQHYAHDDVLTNVTDVFAHIKIGGEVTFNDDVVSFDIAARVLYSPLNTGTLNPS